METQSVFLSPLIQSSVKELEILCLTEEDFHDLNLWEDLKLMRSLEDLHVRVYQTGPLLKRPRRAEGNYGYRVTVDKH